MRIILFFDYPCFNKYDNLVKKGEVYDKLFFIDSGIIAEFSDSDSHQLQTNWILGENEWIFQPHSFLTNVPSDTSIKALENVKAFFITKPTYFETIKNLPELWGFINKIYDRHLLQLENRNRFHRIKNASDRLEYFEKNQKNICNLVQLKYIASYLNVSPSELSRIR